MKPRISLPVAFLDQMEKILGAQQLPLFQQTLDAPSSTSIRLNTLKNFQWEENFGKVKWNNNGVYLSERPSFTLDPAFHAGAYYVQEASSMLIGTALEQLIDLSQPVNVLDLCAAPGGKSTLLASLLSPNSFLLANEVIRTRYHILKQNMSKWGSPNSHVSNHDSKDFLDLPEFFDVAVVDAPCSGEGLFRKDKAAISEWSEANVQLCCQRQKRILAQAVKTLHPDGILLYSTCTYNELENNKNVQWLMENFELEEAPLEFPETWGTVSRPLGVQCYPHLVQGEGFYLAALRKKGSPNGRKLTAKGFKKLQRLTKKEADIVKGWLNPDQKVTLFKTDFGSIRAILDENLEAAFAIAGRLSRLSLGVEIGSFKRQDFIPSHELALSTLVAKDLPHVDLNKEQALHYLSKEPIPVSDLPPGWQLVQYQGLNLGWIKGLKNRINNYYPKEWRIKMDWKSKKINS